LLCGVSLAVLLSSAIAASAQQVTNLAHCDGSSHHTANIQPFLAASAAGDN